MNDEDAQYDELRWLVRDARQTRQRSIRRTAYAVATAMVLGGAYLLTEPPASTQDGTTPTDHTEAVNQARTGVIELTGRVIPDVEGRLEDSHGDILSAIAGLERKIELLTDRVGSLDFSETTRFDLNTRLGEIARLRSDYAVAKWLWVVDRPDSGEWRWYPMKQGDTLWIPEGNFYVELETLPLAGSTISVVTHLGAGDANEYIGREDWTLTLNAAAEEVAVREYVAYLYYAARPSLTAGFTALDGVDGEYIDIAICWRRGSQPDDACSTLPPTRALR